MCEPALPRTCQGAWFNGQGNKPDSELAILPRATEQAEGAKGGKDGLKTLVMSMR